MHDDYGGCDANPQAADHAESGVCVRPRRRLFSWRFWGWGGRRLWQRQGKGAAEIRAEARAAAHGGRSETMGGERSHRCAACGGGGAEASRVGCHARVVILVRFVFVVFMCYLWRLGVSAWFSCPGVVVRSWVSLSVPTCTRTGFVRFQLLVPACTSRRRSRVNARAFMFPGGGWSCSNADHDLRRGTLEPISSRGTTRLIVL